MCRLLGHIRRRIRLSGGDKKVRRSMGWYRDCEGAVAVGKRENGKPMGWMALLP
jgi:hypothetical protein